MTLQQLADEYARDRAAMDTAHPMVPEGTCRYYGKQWRVWPGGKFTGHVKCAVSSEFRAKLVAMLKSDARLSYTIVATALGTTQSVIHAWWRRETGNPFP